ncbi:protein FANTASTIC FOUR 1-like [Neltuma alba]|uniref:protein FANTASTIC FOUR 1-like n=1 Tax=Neltuma alba TaxID=207710 RepID=UPI0010A396B4|nr:protein FANTASTIC FOUR 1-like [Prosopis alba]
MDQLEDHPAEDCCLTGTAEDIGAEICRRRSHGVRKEVSSFPPPLSSLNLNGQPSFYLRPVRKDGRLKLIEVRIHRPKILHAWRHDGRLTLHLIPEEESSIDNLEDDGEEEEEEEEEEGEELEEEMVKAIRDDEEEEFRFGDWRFGSEVLRRCHQELNDHGGHDHHLHKHPLRLQMPGMGIA